MKTKSLFLTLLALVVATGLTAKVKKIGMIGLDTSHSIAFVKSFNDKSGPHAGLGEYRVVAAYPHGSYTIPSSYERIPAYTDSVKKYGVEIVGSIDDLLKQRRQHAPRTGGTGDESRQADVYRQTDRRAPE